MSNDLWHDMSVLNSLYEELMWDTEDDIQFRIEDGKLYIVLTEFPRKFTEFWRDHAIDQVLVVSAIFLLVSQELSKKGLFPFRLNRNYLKNFEVRRWPAPAARSGPWPGVTIIAQRNKGKAMQN